MPTLIRNNSIEPVTLPRPWLRMMKPGEVGYLRPDPDQVRAIIGAENVSRELQMQLVPEANVPAGAYAKLDPADDEFLPSVATTDATPTLLWEMTLADNTAYDVDFSIVARRSDGGTAARARYKRNVLVYREAGGIATIQGSVVTPTADVESVGGWDVTIQIDGANKLQVLVTGAAAAGIRWQGRITSLLSNV
jgi:hypothetical protein